MTIFRKNFIFVRHIAITIMTVCCLASMAAGTPTAIWGGSEHDPDAVSSVPISDGCFFPSPVIEGVEANLQGFTFDGLHYWATVETTDHPPGHIPDGKVLKLDPTTFAVLATFDHPSTAPTGITYNQDADVYVTVAPLGGPRESPWEAGEDFFFVHDPQTLAVTSVYTALPGTDGLFYDPVRKTYFSVEVVNKRLNEHRSADFAIINSYLLPGAPHDPRGVVVIPNPQGGPPHIVVNYAPDHEHPQDVSGFMIQTLQLVDHELRLLSTLWASGGYAIAAGDLAWHAQRNMLVTVGAPWLHEEAHLAQVGIYLHHRPSGCYVLPGIPPWLTFVALPIASR